MKKHYLTHQDELLDETLVMLDVVNTAIETGILPAIDSPMQKKIHNLLKRGDYSVSWSKAKRV